MKERKMIILQFNPILRETLETVAINQNFFQPNFLSDHELSYIQSGIPLSSYIANASCDELIFLFMSLGEKSLETLKHVLSIKNFRLEIDFSIDQIYIMPENKFINFQLPNISDSNKETIIQNSLSQLGSTLIEINDRISNFESRNNSNRKKPNFFVKFINSIFNSEINENEIQNLIKKFEKNQICSLFSCVFCDSNTESIDNQIVEMDSEHYTHLKCFSTNMVVPILEAKSMSQIYCKKKNNAAHQDCGYNDEGKCNIKCNRSFIKCFCEKNYHKSCEESKNNECLLKIPKKKCNCKNQVPCEQCILDCAHELIPLSFFRDNKAKLPFTIIRKFQILMLKEHYHPATHEDCPHTECIKYIDSEKLKPTNVKLSCKHTVCSFCLSLKCVDKRCQVFKEFLNKSGLKQLGTCVHQDLIL